MYFCKRLCRILPFGCSRRGSSRQFSSEARSETSFVIASNNVAFEEIARSLTICSNFVSESEETLLYEEVQNYLRKLRYEYDHWDNAIHGFRETEKTQWSPENQVTLQRLKKIAFPEASVMPRVHVLDLAKNGYIKPHIDSTRFCGDTIAGICLLSACVMRIVHEKDKSKWADCLLDRRSLYIMRGASRFDYTHEVLKEEESFFNGQKVPRERRISIICRNKPITS